MKNKRSYLLILITVFEILCASTGYAQQDIENIQLIHLSQEDANRRLEGANFRTVSINKDEGAIIRDLVVMDNCFAICLSDKRIVLIDYNGAIIKSVQFDDITDAYKLYFSQEFNSLALGLGVPSYFVIFNNELDIVAVGEDELWKDRHYSIENVDYMRGEYLYYVKDQKRIVEKDLSGNERVIYQVTGKTRGEDVLYNYFSMIVISTIVIASLYTIYSFRKKQL